MADGLDIGALAGRIEFEDKTSVTLDMIVAKLDAVDKKFDDVDKTVGNTAKGFLAAEVTLQTFKKAAEVAADVIHDLVVEGSGLASVAENFDRMATQSGRLGSTMLHELREGTHNTIDDMQLMKTLNQDLAAGMNLTDEQLRKLADGAFALAQATGGDVKSAFDTMNQAMLTGQTRALTLLTGKIDLAQAEQNLATKLGTTADRLNAEGKLEAARAAILQSVGQATERLGEQTDGMGEKVAQVQTKWANFYNGLAISVSTSPEIARAFDAIEAAVVRAFGGDKQQMIKDITGWIDGFAKQVAIVGPPVVEVLGQITSGLGWFMKGLASDISGGQDIFHKVGLLLQGYSLAEADAMVKTFKLTEEMNKQSHVAKEQADALAKTEAAAKAQAEQADKAREERNRLIIQQTNEEIKKRREAMEEINSVTNTYRETVDKLDKDMVTAIKGYLEAGVAQDKLATAYGLTSAQISAIVKVMKDEDTAMKLQAKQASDSQARWEQYYATQIEMSGRATDAVIADIKRWEAAQIKSHVDAKTDTADFYAWLAAASRQAQEKADLDRLQQDEHSKAYWVQQKVSAEDAYQFALAHADQFTSGYIEMLRKTKEAATDAAAHWQDQLGDELDDLTEKVDRLKGAMEFGGSFEVTSQNFAEALHKNNTFGGWSQIGHFDEAQGYALARKGYSFEEIISILNAASTSSGPIPPPKGPRIPGFRDGGIGNFGEGTLAVLHGREAIVPLDDGRSGVGGVTNHFYVNGTAEDVARKIGDILIRNYKMSRQVASS